MRPFLAPALSLFIGALSLFGSDLTITSHISGKGAFAKEGTQVQYFSASRMRVNHDTTKIDSMVDYGQGAIYSIDHGKKVVTKMTFQDMQEAMQSMEDQMAGMPEFVTKMMFGDTSETKVEPLGTDMVMGRPCKKVRITLGKLVEELSMDPSLQFPFKDYAKAMAMLNRMPGQMGALIKRINQEMGQLKGVPLKTRVSGLMGMDMTTEATAVSTAAIPGSIWALPADYAVKDGGKELKESMKKGR